MQGIVNASSSLFLHTQTLPRLEFSVDHAALLWCKQLVTLMSNSLTALHTKCIAGGKVCCPPLVSLSGGLISEGPLMSLAVPKSC